MKVYIAHYQFPVVNKRALFILSRPFFKEGQWMDDLNEKERWGLDFHTTLVSTIAQADVVLLPFSINHYVNQGRINALRMVSQECHQFSKQAYGFVEGDFGIAYPEFPNITYFRMGGFQTQLSSKNKGFPVALSDHFKRIFGRETISPLSKGELPVVGFCGHATTASVKRFKELVKCIKENLRRFFLNPFRKDWEHLFASAYERATVLKYLEKAPSIKTNFIYRNHYRGGAQSEDERNATTLEYYNNIAASDYILCVRGAGNFSVRFYETLMMGKIPIFVNTDCLLPFEEHINWKQHMVWVEWSERKNIVDIVSKFHNNLTHEDFKNLQIANRKLWEEQLSVKGIYNNI